MSNPTDLSTTNIINCKPAVIIFWSNDGNLRKVVPYFGFILHNPVYWESKKSSYPRFIFGGKSTGKEVNWFQLVHINTFKPITVARKVDHSTSHLFSLIDCGWRERKSCPVTGSDVSLEEISVSQIAAQVFVLFCFILFRFKVFVLQSHLLFTASYIIHMKKTRII